MLSPVPGPGCVFCRIAAGEAAADRIFEDGDFLAFLDARPLFPGHVLLIPRAHYSTLLELPPALGGPLIARAQRVARALGRALGAEGTFVAMNNVVSQSVPHLHVHVVPRRKKDGLRGFFWPRQAYGSAEERAAIAAQIAAALEIG
ncbi:MAG: HIT family protein [Deltaproteobacteria bacterium]|nr:HIT family protein [Deltaproteobacteria bacterium]